jgi:type II secretory pathway pseudopilin PulG
VRHPGSTPQTPPFDKPRAGPASRRPSRKAFTTLELLVVIGIILLLMAISVLGFRHFDRLASVKQTHAQLNLCKNLLIEYERANGLKYIEGPLQPNPTPPPLYVPVVYTDPTPPPNNYDYKAKIQLTDLAAGAGSDMGTHSSNASARYAAAAVTNTRAVMAVLTGVPANRTAITNVPANRLLEATSGSAQPPGIGQAVILDGWSNPIIFVPVGGMVVNIKDPTNTSQTIQFVVRSSGTFPVAQLPQHPITALDRPFFASAGQDADFTQGEDNVYSFQQD